MKKSGKWFWGLYFILAAFAIVLYQLDYFEELNLLGLVFIVLMIPIILKGLVNFEWVGVFFPLGILLIVFDEALGFGNISIWIILSIALFLSVGMSFLVPSKHKWFGNHMEKQFENICDVSDDELINCISSFSSTIKYVNTDNFVKGNFGSSFGSMKVYFDNVKLNKDGGVANVSVSFGEMTLFIPREWRIVNNVTSSLAAVDNNYRRSNDDENAPILVINGHVSFGNLEIVYI